MPLLSAYEGPHQAIKQWDAEQGGKSLRVLGYCLYPNGARRTYGPQGGELSPPAERADERQRAIIRYWENYVAIAAQEFYDRRDQLLREADHIASVGGTAKAEEELKALQKVVKDARRSLKDAQNEALRIRLNAPTIKDALRIQAEREASEQSSRQRHADAKHKAKETINAIVI